MTHATIFIGYDAREHEAAQVAAFSLRRRATCHVRIYPIEHRLLRRLEMFNRPWQIDSEGQFFDERDGRPFSTEFSHSRFLVFELARRLKVTGPCMFVDCDWHFLADIEPLMAETAKSFESIGVVMRDRKVEEGSTKMDGMIQQNYSRKLWSAMFTFMPRPWLFNTFDVQTVNNAPGRDLHGFLGAPDTSFWPIDPAWHFIPSLDERPDDIKGVHYSEFSPWLNSVHDTGAPDLCEKWQLERIDTLTELARKTGHSVFDNLEVDLVAASA